MIASIALAALCLAFVALAWRWRPSKPPEPGVRILLAGYAFLGAWALWFGVLAPPGSEPRMFAHLRPTVVYWMLASTLFVSPPLGLGLPIKAILGSFITLSPREWLWINRGFAVIFTALGAANLFMVYGMTEDDWEGFKFSCAVNFLIIFLLRLAFVWMDIIVRAATRLYGIARKHL